MQRRGVHEVMKFSCLFIITFSLGCQKVGGQATAEVQAVSGSRLRTGDRHEAGQICELLARYDRLNKEVEEITERFCQKLRERGFILPIFCDLTALERLRYAELLIKIATERGLLGEHVRIYLSRRIRELKEELNDVESQI